jgi:uncharacterized protein DUF4175/signal transduction histidine kinase-like protein
MVRVRDPSVEIAAFVGAVRRRLRRAQLWRGVGVGGGFAGGALALLLVGAALVPGTAWRPLALLFGGGGLGAGIVFAVKAAARWRRDESVARLVGERVPGIGDELWSAVELTRELPRLDAEPLLSPTLVRAHQARVAERLRAIDLSRVVPLRRLRSGWPLLAAISAIVAFARFWPAGLERGWAALTSAEPPPATSSEPIVADVELTLKYPAYTELPPRVIPGTSGHVLALPGTQVSIAARTLVAVGSAALQVESEGEPARELPVEVRDGRLAASFEVRSRGSWRFVLGAGAHRVREPEAHRIDLEPDRAPRVDLYAPGDPLEVAGPRRIELAWSVDDDYGLGAVELVWRSGEGPERRRTVEANPPSGSRALQGRIEWDLGELDLKPGVKVAYHLEAKDNDTVPGPNVGRSKTLTLSMFSPREKQERALGDQQQLLEEAIQLLADRLEVKRVDDEAVVEAFTRLHSRAEALLLSLARAEQSGGEVKAARDLKATLGEMHTRLGKLTREEEATLTELRDRRRKTGQPLHGGAARPLEKGNVANVAELERDVIALDDLVGKQRLEELLAVADEMAATRDRLKQLLAEYKKTRSEAVKKEIERELRELERKLAELQQKAQRLAAELPDQFLNAEAMGNNDLQKRLSDLKQLLDKGDIDKAMAELDQLSSSLDRMMSSMESDLRGFRRERFSAEEKALGELENKLADLSEEERRLRDETAEVRQRARTEAQRQMKDKLEALTRRTREKLARLKKQLETIDPLALSGYDQDELGRIKKRVDDTSRALGEGDVDEARGMARQAHEGLRQMAMDLHDEEMRSWTRAPPKLRKTRDQVGDDEMLAREIAEELDKAMPKPSQLVGGDDKKKLSDLGKRQEALRKRAQELGRELGKPRLGPDGKPMPLPIPREIGPGLRDAGQHMERAEDDLRGQAAREAVGEEGQALEKLEQMKQQMQRERRPKEAMQGGRMDKEPVRIPGADEFRAPKEFRQDLLEAMKRGAPAQYKEQLKRYYEELAK